ncbi:hypothetical protein MOK15_20640 [Sphingobium sp. BYY-5]|uniref:hypothetical protein n=1 Tax=Sphingobium sp. BYY-5 TaxID=2926400 RepID=UPI001FA6C42E|nr:hypothetical protein [Sphingobium sp. BYY-5]MCI4592474.1 hypothetical protein [Sphingobium sp. BYY-5]
MATAVSHDLDAPTPELTWLAIQQFWQLPLIVTTSWWNALTDALWPCAPADRSPADDHDQLVVPEPFEVEGEHGLFA